MANDRTSRPWSLDTPGVITTDRVFIYDIAWTDQVAAGDHLVILDKNGKTIIDSRADAPNDMQRFGKGGWVNGINLSVLDSGKVLLFP